MHVPTPVYRHERQVLSDSPSFACTVEFTVEDGNDVERDIIHSIHTVMFTAVYQVYGYHTYLPR